MRLPAQLLGHQVGRHLTAYARQPAQRKCACAEQRLQKPVAPCAPFGLIGKIVRHEATFYGGCKANDGAHGARAARVVELDISRGQPFVDQLGHGPVVGGGWLCATEQAEVGCLEIL